jgi:outer membrane protein assembly factor BamB
VIPVDSGKEPAVPVDLDEMFTAMGRQADALPLGGSEAARRLGARRTRNRNSLVATAAAVLLVIAGVGAVVRRQDRSPEPILPAGTIRGLEPIGTPLQVYGPANQDMTGRMALIDDRVYVASGSMRDDQIKVIGVDTATGAKTWDGGAINSFETNVPIAVPGAVLLADGSTLHVHDPSTGKRLWDALDPSNGDVVVGDGVLVQVTEGGLSEGFELTTGEKLWSVPASGANRPRHTAGFSGDVPQPRNSRDIEISDGRITQITLGGKVLVRDIRTGEVLKSVSTTVRPKMMTDFGTAGALVLIGDKSGYTDKPSRLIAVDATTGTTRELWSVTAGSLRLAQPCGAQRLCVSFDDNERMRLLMIDITTGQPAWTVDLTEPIAVLSARNGKVATTGMNGSLTVYGADGQVVSAVEAKFSGNFANWIDDQNLLVRTPNQDGTEYTLTAVSAEDGRQTPLTTLSRAAGACEWSSDVLACLDGVQLKLWRFQR